MRYRNLLCATSAMLLSVTVPCLGQPLDDVLSEAYFECIGFDVSNVDGEVAFFEGAISSFPAPRSIEADEGISAADCLTSITGQPWAYDRGRSRFGTGVRYEMSLDAENQLRAVGVERAASALRELFSALSEGYQQQNRALLLDSIIEACADLASRDPTLAFTNETCVSSFSQYGHPDLPSFGVYVDSEDARRYQGLRQQHLEVLEGLTREQVQELCRGELALLCSLSNITE